MPANQTEEKIAVQGEMFCNRLRKRFRHLKKWAKRTETNAFRLYDRDIPEIPLVLDLYGDAVSGALYKRPYEKDAEEEAYWLKAMQDAAARALDIPAATIFLKERDRQRGNNQYDKLMSQNITRDITEGGLRFRVNLSDYLDTGFFPDRRRLRDLVRTAAAGKRVLNLFCYTASFSVYAAAGGAKTVDSVDMSRTYLEWAAVNFALNGFKARMIQGRDLLSVPKGDTGRETGDRLSTGGLSSSQDLPSESRLPFRLIRGDALRFIGEARKAGLTWDLIVLDPPAFSNSKRMDGALDIRRDHRELIARTLALLSPGGTLWFSASTRNFRLEPGDFPLAKIEDITEQLRDEDFRGKKIPVCYGFRT
jgi:23S rRNA G2069 N7-methylase RlmK/C1962 C5-methylase RlmI